MIIACMPDQSQKKITNARFILLTRSCWGVYYDVVKKSYGFEEAAL